MLRVDFQPAMKVTTEAMRRLANDAVADAAVPRREDWARPGLVVGFGLNGGLDERWLPVFDGGEVTISAPTVQIVGSLSNSDNGTPIAPGTAALSGTLYLVDEDGHLVELDTTFQGAVEIPDDGTWRTLIAKSVTTTRERGTIAFTTGSTTVVGSGTRFTDMVAYDESTNCTQIRIDEADSANGNDGLYEVDEIVSDTELVLRAAPAGTTESGLPFTVESRPYNRSDVGHALFERRVVELELVARTITSADGFVLADVVSTSGVGQVIDRRAGSVHRRLLHRRGGISLVPRYDAVTAAVETVEDVVTSPASDCYAMSAAPTSTGSLWAVTRDGARHLDAVAYPGNGGSAGSPVAISSTSGSDSPALVKLPDGGPYTHLCVYHRAGVIYARRTADEGATWTSETTVWTPSAASSGAAASEPDAVCLLNGRIIVVATHTPATGASAIRYVTSDDGGGTWSTNSNAGSTWATRWSGGTQLSVTAPRIAQGADGRIWTCWLGSGAVFWRVSDSADQLATALSTPVGTASSTVTPSTSCERPDLLVGDDGCAFVVWIDKFATSHTEVWGAPLIGGSEATARPRRLFRIDAGAGSSGAHHIHAYQDLGGVLLAYNTAGESTIAVNFVGCDLLATR